ncbi:WD repeat-containing protein mio [Paragonimus westermani]|uniref:WD repeat-containing protein mio n=1 Tax=Paragonimus westermani TaxID=34504 RepID=A0A8T0CYD2_9TREM|nr:WD repeat-containing protein mio [Paragonimus westermani]
MAQGVDRTRSLRDSTVIIWDVTKSSDARTENQYDTGGTGIDVTSSKQQGSPKLKQIYAVQSLIDSPVSHAEVMRCDRSLCDIGTQEVTSSFAWLSKSSFIVGMSGTSLKVFDLSDPSKPCQMTSTRAVHGLTVDPFCTTRIASYFESRVSLWKLNNLEKPVYTFTEQHDVCQIKWSPLKEAWLGVLVNDSSTVKLYYTYPMFLQPLEESEQTPLEHTVFPSGRSATPLVSFSWHPMVADCLLTLDRDGCLDVAQIIKRAAIAWSPEHTLLWTHGAHWSSFNPGGFKSSRLVESHITPVGQSDASLGNLVTQESVNKIAEQSSQQLTNSRAFADLDHLLVEDIAYVMQRRAEMGYGTAKDPTTYIGLFRNDIQLRTMWVWIKYIQDYLTEFVVRSRVADAESVQTGRSNGLKESGSRSRGATRCLGALAILSGESNQSGLPTPSEVLTCVDWQGVDARLPFPRYRSPERSHVLRLCMWRLDDTDEVQRRVFESVCAEGEYGRAATMALFNLKFNWALSFLNRASTVHSSQTKVESKRNSTNEILINQEIGLVSLALAGYTDSNNDLWRATCASLFNRLENPYLRVMFAFLTRQGGDFNVILYNEDLRLNDRLAFACLYLDDNELLTFVKNTCDQMVLTGRLEAVLLTGIASTDFISLVQNYVDLTGDVQTAAIVGLRACQLCCSSSAPNSRYVDCGPRRSELSGTRNAASVAAAVVEEKIGRSSGRGAVVEKEAPPLLILGGIRIAAWVQGYRDLLDQWRMWFCRADFDIANKVSLMSDYLTSATSHSKSTNVNPTTVNCSPQSPSPGSNAASSTVGDGGPGGTVRENSQTSVHEALLGAAHRSANKPRLNMNLIAPVNQVT